MIHHAMPSDKIYPLCICDFGPHFRDKAEREFPVPFDLKAAKPAL